MVGSDTNGNARDPEMQDGDGGARPQPVAPIPAGLERLGARISPSLAAPPSSPGAPAFRNSPSLDPLPPPAASNAARDPDKAQAKRRPIFVADLPHGEDALGVERRLRPVAEIAVHRDSETPLTIGLLGGAGSGKSFALGKLMAMIEALSGSSAGRDGSAFVSPVACVRIDAASFSDPPAVALAAALFRKLSGKFSELAREAAHAVRDPHVVAREAAEELDIVRRRLDTERQNLAELEARRARLTETVLFEQAGSQVDSYARANRAKIEARLEGFGVTGDAVQNYKSMVRDIAESGGGLARVGAALRAFWAFKGQMRLLVTAVVLVLIAFGCDAAVANQSAWVDALQGVKGMGPLAGWVDAHVGWLGIVKQFAFAGALLAVLANVWRGLRFLRPLFRGVSLLETEVANRRRDLDQLYAHQMRRVDALGADVELASRRAAEADRRAANEGGRDRADTSPFETPTPRAQAERFFAALATAVQRGWRGNDPVSAVALPYRIIVGLDNVDRLPGPQARELIDTLRRCFDHSAFVTAIAVDPQRLAVHAGAGSEAEKDEMLEQWIQIPLRLGSGRDAAHYGALVGQAVGSAAAPNSPRPRQEPFDWAISEEEERLLTALAPLAGPSPRGVKRFVNLYRIARSEAPDDKPILAFMLALDQAGSEIDRAVVTGALAGADPEAAFAPSGGSPQLAAALAAVRMVQDRLSVGAARRAGALAEAYSLRI